MMGERFMNTSRLLGWAFVAWSVTMATAGAQSVSENLTTQLGDTVLTLRQMGDDNRPTGPEMTMRLFETGAAQITFDGNAEENWAIWRVSEGGAFCTVTAIDSGGTLLRVGTDEDCVALDLEGNAVRLTFFPTTGGTQAFEGTLRPM